MEKLTMVLLLEYQSKPFILHQFKISFSESRYMYKGKNLE